MDDCSPRLSSITTFQNVAAVDLSVRPFLNRTPAKARLQCALTNKRRSVSASPWLDWPLLTVRPIRAPGAVPHRFNYAIICSAVAIAGIGMNPVAVLDDVSTGEVVLFQSTHDGSWLMTGSVLGTSQEIDAPMVLTTCTM